MDFWETLEEGTQHLIFISSGIGAIGVIWFALSKIQKKVKQVRDKVGWIFEDRTQHEEIKLSIKQVAEKLTKYMNRMEHKTDFMYSYIRTTLHTSSKAVFETDGNGQCIYVNQAYTRLMRISAHEAMGSGWINLLDPDFKDINIAAWQTAVAGKHKFDGIVAYKRPDGSKFKAHVTAFAILTSNSEVMLLGHIGEVVPE